MKLFLPALLCLAACGAAARQAPLNQPAATGQGTLAIRILSAQHAPLENASVELLSSRDSSLVRAVLAGPDGEAVFDQVSAGSYLVRASAAGHGMEYTAPFSYAGPPAAPELRLPDLVLSGQHAHNTLGEVVVSARRPFIQKLSDRIVVNVDNSIVNAGSTAMEVLERSPGVQIDQNDAISLRGRQGVTILIDGKPSPLSGTDLANYLRGLPSSAIERIDLISNPSARYDASGNAGLIDIRMKKDQRLGANGTLTAGYGQGVYPKTNAGTTFNYRNRKVNVFGNYNYAYRVGMNHLILDRNFYSDGTYTGGDLKDNAGRSPVQAHAGRLGLDYFASPRTTLGAVVNGNFNRFDRLGTNHSVVLDDQHAASSTFRTLSSNHDHTNNVTANLNFRHRFDSSGRELTTDLDYGRYHLNSLSRSGTGYYNLDGTKQQPDYVLDGDQLGLLHFTTFKSDYTTTLPKSARLEAGFKLSFVSSDNDARFEDVSSGVPVNDTTKTNHFVYRENNQAAYLNYSREQGRFSWQAGLRAEQTEVSTRQEKGDIRWDSSYLQLFPSAFVTYKLAKDQTLGLSVGRRIDRPGYSMLNPFLFLIDVTTYATGAPGLLPQFTWSYELSYTMRNLNFTLGYSHTVHDQNIAIVRFRDVFPNIPSADNVTVQIPINLASSDYFGLTVAAPLRIRPWWNSINNGNFYYQHYNGYLGGTTLHNGKPAFDVRSNNTFTLGRGWNAEANVNYNSGGQYGFMVSRPQWGLATGLQKTGFQGKGTFRFSITDIFWTDRPRATITYTNYVEKWRAYRETRVATLSFTYRFGKSTVAQARRRNTGSEEERRRAGN
ncbi:MAG TPA: TonB-dependent receptor [Chitinophagaceae bacterium]|nr:TonB-dependent receptor [Chitinophagaceae bacterium]